MQKSERMGSALMLVGAEGIGKKKIVEQLVSQIGVNPEVMVVERERNDKDDLKKNIGIEQVRELIQRLSMSSLAGGQKIGIIDGAETLSIEAANALLKTLEDPMGDVLVILLATSTAAIPATVLSRCQVVYVPTVSIEEICDALVARGAGREDAHEIASFAAGRPGIALALLHNQELLAAYREHRMNLASVLKASLAERIGLIGEITKSSKENLEELLNVWELELHKQQAYQLLMNLIRARSAIKQNVTSTLALEHAFI